jgi:putative ABC transport system permease protein
MRTFRNFLQALRGIGSNRLNAALMMLGIVVGIASLTVIVAVGEGVKNKVLKRIANLGFGPESFSVISGAGRLFFKKAENPESMTLQDAEDIRSLPTVSIVVPRQRKRLKAIYQKKFTDTRAYGVTPDWVIARDWEMEDGRFLNDSDMRRKRKVAVLGATPVRNLFEEKDPIGKMVRLDDVFFEVIGVLLEKGVTESGYDPDNRILVPLPTTMSRLLNQTHLHSIRVRTFTSETVPETMEAVTEILRRNHGLSSLADNDFRYITPAGIMQWVTEQKQAMNRMLVLISTVSLLVGGIVIMNIMLVSIRERVKEIGVRRCFGARRMDIAQQFLFEAVLISITGGLLGALLGFALAETSNQLDLLPAKITWEPLVSAFVLCGLIGLVFGVQPARKASQLNPDETLRA